MRKTVTIAAGIAVIAMMQVGGARAALNDDLLGSDTLFEVTRFLVDVGGGSCPGAGALTYRGGGSSRGEDAITAQVGSNAAPTQFIAPMSRFLRTDACKYGNGVTAEGFAHALDGLAVVRSATDFDACVGVAASGSVAVTERNGVGGLQCRTCSGGNYTYTSIVDVLRLVFSGLENDTESIALQDCNSDVRRSIVADWENIFQGTCPGEECATSPVRHAYRRADLSGTTDTFLSFLDLPSISEVPFCNGIDLEDNDPIRVDCATAPTGFVAPGDVVDGSAFDPSGQYEEVCGKDGTLGLVQAVFVPENNPLEVEYPTTVCQTGVFGFAPAPFGNDPCFNGGPQLFQLCLTPAYSLTPGGEELFDCQNLLFGNFPTFFQQGPDPDARVYNFHTRQANGQFIQDSTQRDIIGAFYRQHATHTLTGGSTCQQPDSTTQIGCLAQASNCTIGFAGLAAADQVAGTNALQVDGIDATAANVRRISLCAEDGTTLCATDDDCATTCGLPNPYPLSRFLFANTVLGYVDDSPTDGFVDGIATGICIGGSEDGKGCNTSAPACAGGGTCTAKNTLASVNPQTAGAEDALAVCFGDRFYADPAALAGGFIPLTSTTPGSPGQTATLIVDFDESVCN